MSPELKAIKAARKAKRRAALDASRMLVAEQRRAYRTTRTVAPPGSDLARLRMQCHRTFDPIWEFGIMSRNEVYRRLARAMSIPQEECHFGMFDIQRCQQALALRSAVTED